jgi:hypothetical protein
MTWDEWEGGGGADPGDRNKGLALCPSYSSETAQKIVQLSLFLLGELTKNGAKGDAIPFWII